MGDTNKNPRITRRSTKKVDQKLNVRVTRTRMISNKVGVLIYCRLAGNGIFFCETTKNKYITGTKVYEFG